MFSMKVKKLNTKLECKRRKKRSVSYGLFIRENFPTRILDGLMRK